MRSPAHMAPKRRKFQSGLLFDLCKAFRLSKFDRNARYMLTNLGDADLSYAVSRIMQDNVTSRHLLQYDEMIHIPVNDCRQLQLSEMRKFDPQGTAREMQFLCNSD